MYSLVLLPVTGPMSTVNSFRQIDGGSWGTRAPSDILYYFFVMAIKDTPTTAITVSQVCRRWRATAISSPTLWTKISMVCIRAHQQHSWTVTYLKRSQSLPISFYLKAHRKMSVREVEVVLTRHAHRFRSLSVLASNYRLTFTLWPQFSQAMASLTNFEYRVIGDIRVHVQRDNPPIQPFQIAGTSRHGLIEWAKWDASTITSLTLNYIGPESKLSLRDFHEIFVHCRHTLTRLELLGFAPTQDKKDPVPRIALPVLETLLIGYIDTIVPFMELIHMPRLHSLTLRDILQTPENHLYKPRRDWYFGMQATHVGRIFELMQGVHLTHLAIYGEQFGFPAEFRHLLLGLKALKSLVLYAAAETYYDVLFEDQIILPSLSDLLITYVDHTRSLSPFFGRRAAAKSQPLRKLTLTNDCVLVMEAEGFLEGVMAGCPSISAITDPVLEMYNVVAEGEREIVVNGVVIV
ncbi:hypothetical protein BDZ94DRAFT_1294966 [Collybia nuda]|uniref:F-box domain-containing protein n=1 Tax=Collybia nuda TaxID=64659 RepID=A0A9P5YFJ9_9AGAR|nr:hypothetical protein BDZ94DRAFT_1294966 [Collybia nuda]